MADGFNQLSASKRYESELENKDISVYTEMSKLFRYIVLAGGSSQLPCFKELLEEHLQVEGANFEILCIEEDYEYAVAGGLAATALENYDENKDFFMPPADLFFISQTQDGKTSSKNSGPKIFDLENIISYFEDTNTIANFKTETEAKKIRDRGKRYKPITDGQMYYCALTSEEEHMDQDIRSEDLPVELRGKDPYRYFILNLKAKYTNVRGVRIVPLIDEEQKEYVLHIFDTNSPSTHIHCDRWPILDMSSANLKTFIEKTGDQEPEDCGLPLCFDFGTSKTICIIANPSIENIENLPEDKIIHTKIEKSQYQEPLNHVLTQSIIPSPVVSEVKASKTIQKIDDFPNLSVRASFDEIAFLQEFHQELQESGFSFSQRTLINLYLSFQTSPFIILSGAPGVGKTSLARMFSHKLGCYHENKNFVRVSVEANWVKPRDLFETQSNQPTPFTELLYHASHQEKYLFCALFDEINLAQIDHYFSDILSTMSDNGQISFPTFFPDSVLCLPLQSPNHRIFMIGTMNVDDASQSLTDKVLDRAHILELEAQEPQFISYKNSLMKTPNVQNEVVGYDNWSATRREINKMDVPEEIIDLWRCIKGGEDSNTRRKSLGAKLNFGYRTIRDMTMYMQYAQIFEKQEGDWKYTKEMAIDDLICQKILPRFRGSEQSRVILEDVKRLSENQGYDRASMRLERMTSQCEIEYSFSFWSS